MRLLAIGVPPMLLGIPGDNTYSNYAEAQRAFWRQTVLPLVNRMANGFSNWLGPAFARGGSLSIAPSDSASRSRPEGAGLLLKPDLDQVEALNPEREALWSRLEGVSFLTDDEKRAAAGYAATGDSGAKYRADQPRVPAGNSDGGRWTGEGGDTRPYSQNDSAFRVAQVGSGRSGYPYDILEEDQLGGIFSTPENAVPPKGGRDDRVRVAQAGGDGSGYPVYILEEDTLGGHTFERHVGKSEEYLKARVLENRVNIPYLNWSGGEARAGSFTSLEAANKLVNSALSDPVNREKVNAFARGDFLYSLPVLQLFKSFETPTGYEAYARGTRQPIIRPTYSVRVRLWRSSSVPKGYYVDSAWPENND